MEGFQGSDIKPIFAQCRACLMTISGVAESLDIVDLSIAYIDGENLLLIYDKIIGSNHPSSQQDPKAIITNKICNKCLIKLLEFYNFWKQCRENESLLLSSLQVCKGQPEEVPITVAAADLAALDERDPLEEGNKEGVPDQEMPAQFYAVYYSCNALTKKRFACNLCKNSRFSTRVETFDHFVECHGYGPEQIKEMDFYFSCKWRDRKKVSS
jgi:Zinc-finger associated domain (zf-AD)